MIVIFENAAILKIGKFFNMKTKFLSQDKVKIRDVPDQLFHAGCQIFPKMICQIGYLAGYQAPAGFSAGYFTSTRK